MNNLTPDQYTYIFTAFSFHAILITHFAIRKWRFYLALHYGRLVYGLAIPAAIVSIALILDHAPWFYWLGGLLYLAWATFGYWIEYKKEIEWRNPVRRSTLIPYITLYLSTVMFYWWPLARVYKPMWYAGGLAFLLSTILNVTSHKRGESISSEAVNNAHRKTHGYIGEIK